MVAGPKVKIAADLHRIEKYFKLENGQQNDFDYNLIIDRQRYDEVVDLLDGFKVDSDQVAHDLCFIILWIEKETETKKIDPESTNKYHQMWDEVEGLRNYLLGNRVTSISFDGEYERNNPGQTFILREEINIDRICDGLRTIFRKEFNADQSKGRKKGMRTWKRRKMTKARNNILNYFTSNPDLDDLPLEDQNHIIDRLASLAGIP